MTQTATDLDAHAAHAWAMLTRHRRCARMHPHAAVDWVRQESGCEDVALVKRALFEAAGAWLAAFHEKWDKTPANYSTRTGSACVLLGRGEFNLALLQAEWIPNSRSVERDWYDAFHTRLLRALALCRQIQELPQ